MIHFIDSFISLIRVCCVVLCGGWCGSRYGQALDLTPYYRQQQQQQQQQQQLTTGAAPGANAATAARL